MRGRVVRHHDELVHRDAEDAALLFGDADDLVRDAGDAKFAPDGIEIREVVRLHVFADDDHRRAELVLLRRREPAGLESHVLDGEPLL